MIIVTTMRGYAELPDEPVEILGGGVGRINCWECGGTGDWTPCHPEPHLFLDGLPCVACKGTGKRLIMAY